MQPKVSILIPVFNGENYMREAIDSALAQTYKNTEIIVVNDGSNDNGATEKIAESYGDKIIYFQQTNKGGAAALNKGISMMSGAYFSWLSHDDLYLPNKIEAQLATLRNYGNPEAIVSSHWININQKGKELSRIKLPAVPPESAFLFLFVKNMVHGCSLLIPKEAFEKVGLFDESLWSTADYDLWLRLSQSYPFILCDEFLVKGRSHDDQYTYKAPAHSEEKERLFLKYTSVLNRAYLEKHIPRTMWAQYFFDVTMTMINRGNFKSMLKLVEHLVELGRGEANEKNQEELLAAVFLAMFNSNSAQMKSFMESYFKLQ